jgi:hypothetical protein
VDTAAEESPDLAVQHSGGDETSECGPACDDLPRRPVTDRVDLHRIRWLNDPEILERVLEGLLNLS